MIWLVSVRSWSRYHLSLFLYAKGELPLDRPFREFLPTFCSWEDDHPGNSWPILLGWSFYPQPGSIGCDTVEKAWKFAVERRQEFHYTESIFFCWAFGWRQVSPALDRFIWRADLYTLGRWQRHGLDRSKRQANGPMALLLEVFMIHKESIELSCGKFLDFFSTSCWSRALLRALSKGWFCAWFVSEFLRVKRVRPALGWNLEGDWLDLTGCLEPSSCTIERGRKRWSLSSRTYGEEGRRGPMDLRRNSLMDLIKQECEKIEMDGWEMTDPGLFFTCP